MIAAPQPTSDAQLVQRNYWHLVWDIAWFGLAFSALNRFLPVFALRMGADETVLGWITSFPALLMTIAATFTLVWRERRTSSVRALMLPTFIYRLMFILPAFAPLLPAAWRIPWIVVTAMLPGIGQGIGAVLFVVILQESMPNERMTDLFSRRSIVFNMTLAASSVVFGIWLEAVPFPYNYQAMYIVAFVLVMLSQWHCSRITPLLAQATTVRRKPAISPWRSKAFRSVLLVLIITLLSFNAVVALIPARLVREMGANEGYMAAYGLVELFAGALISFVAPRLVEKFGIYRMIVGAMIATSVGIALIGASDSLVIGLFAAAISGAGWMLVAMIGMIKLYTDVVPIEDAAQYSIAYHQVVGLVTFAAPFIGTGLINTHLDLSQIMLVGAGLRLTAALSIALLWYTQTYPAHSSVMRQRLMRLVTRRQASPQLPAGSARAGASAAPSPRSPKG
jgi:MFS family permease